MVQIQDYTQTLNKMLINIVAAISILLIGLVIGRFLGKLARKIVKELELERLLEEKLKLVIKVENLSEKCIKYGVYIITIVLSVKQVGVTNKIIYFILIVILGFFVLYLILLIKDYFHNFILGMFIKKDSLKEGNTIELKGIKGIIIKRRAAEIKLVTKDKDIFFIPNAVLIKNKSFRKG